MASERAITYSVLVVADVLVGIAGAISAFDCAINQSYGWMVFWMLVSAGALIFAYWLIKD